MRDAILSIAEERNSMRRQLVDACVRMERRKTESLSVQITTCGSFVTMSEGRPPHEQIQYLSRTAEVRRRGHNGVRSLHNDDDDVMRKEKKTRFHTVMNGSTLEEMVTKDFVFDDVDDVFVRCGYENVTLSDDGYMYSGRVIVRRDRSVESKRLREVGISCGDIHKIKTELHDLKQRQRLATKKNTLHSVLNTLVHMTQKDVWTVELRPGKWEIRAVCGDPCYRKCQRLVVNGKIIVDTEKEEMDCGQCALGRLTLNIRDGLVRVVGSGDSKNDATRLCFMEFVPRWFASEKDRRRITNASSSSAKPDINSIMPLFGTWIEWSVVSGRCREIVVRQGESGKTDVLTIERKLSVGRRTSSYDMLLFGAYKVPGSYKWSELPRELIGETIPDVEKERDANILLGLVRQGRQDRFRPHTGTVV